MAYRLIQRKASTQRIVVFGGQWTAPTLLRIVPVSKRISQSMQLKLKPPPSIPVEVTIEQENCSFLTRNFNWLWLHLGVDLIIDPIDSRSQGKVASKLPILQEYSFWFFYTSLELNPLPQGGESNPEEINLLSAMRGKSGLNTGLTVWGELPFQTKY